MIEAFVNGQLSEADHELMAHHVSTCEECAAAVGELRGSLPATPETRGAEPAAPNSAPIVATRTPVDVLPPTPAATSAGIVASQAPTSVSPPLLPPEPLRVELDSDLIVNAADLHPPPPRELRHDLDLDTSDLAGSELLIHREPVREIALDELQRPLPEDHVAAANAIAAGISRSVAYAAAALAADATHAALEAEDELARAARTQPAVIHPEPAVVQSQEPIVQSQLPFEAAVPLAPDVEPATITPDQEASAASGIAAPGEHAEWGAIKVAEDLSPGAGRVATAIPASLTVDPTESTPAAEPIMVRTEAPRHEPQTVAADAERSPAVGGSLHSRRAVRWTVAAAVLVAAVAGAYAIVQLRAETAPGASGAEAPMQVATPEVTMHPSVLMPVLDAAEFARVIEVAENSVALADTNASGAPDQASSVADGSEPRGTAPASNLSAEAARRPALPSSIVSEPDSQPVESPSQAPRNRVAEPVPEVVRESLSGRTLTRSGSAVATGAPDVPHLLRTTTYHLRPNVLLVLREYDGFVKPPPPGDGATEYQWSDDTGSRYFVLSGPVSASELRAFARQLGDPRSQR